MKSSLIYLSNSIIFLLIFVVVWSFIKIAHKDIPPKIEVGQVWVQIDSLDPFKPIQYDTIKVIDIKGDYSKIIWNGDTTSIKTGLVNWKSFIANNK